ncbi:late transcription factor VLTF-4 [Murmansk poxvirus]|uniref:Late transcription factor VLTF-4 n=1 Tax=Murmansk poxvirus TaxID=2025359 RepID=A0A223FMT5_9POXV|nr:late transcription factor VLTF-4 [Murmansk poxvirus]AST09294.1 late transcription factor VLTF-4 [Murmansk poxvirus]
MAWSMTAKTDTSNFTKMAEIRAHLKNSSETKDKNEDIFPEDVVIPSSKTSTKKQPVRKQPVKKATKKKEEEPTPVSDNESVNNSNNNESTEENSSIRSPHVATKDIRDDEEDIDEDVQAGAPGGSTVQSDISDTKVATDMIVKDLKKLVARISAVASVIEDVQAASIGRQFTALNKSVNMLSELVSEGKSLVVRKKAKTCKK